MSTADITAQQVSTHFIEFHLQYSSLALLYYDYALTLPKEVRYVWKQRFRLSTALYICCRYALVANVLYLLAVAEKLGSTCDLWYKLICALSVLGRTAVTAVFCIRTNAVWGNNRWVLACMSILGVICIVVDIAHVPGSRCVGSSALPIVSKMLSIVVVLFESFSAILTVVRCLIAFRASGGLAQRRHGVMFIIFEQGIVYFCIISIFTTSGVILNYYAPPGFFQRLPDAFTLPLSCILTARFLLYLREHDAAAYEQDSEITPISTAMEFQMSSESRVRSGGLFGILSVDDFGQDPVVALANQGKVVEPRVIQRLQTAGGDIEGPAQRNNSYDKVTSVCLRVQDYA